jgi:hypothetical protein
MSQCPDGAAAASDRQGSLTSMAHSVTARRAASAAQHRAVAALLPAIGDEGIQHLFSDARTTEDRLREVNKLVERAKLALNESVVAARCEGRSWERIGAATNLTRQSAHERWRSLDSKERARAA